MEIHHHTTFGSDRHYGNADIMFLVVEEQDSACSYFNPLSRFISNAFSVLCSHTQNLEQRAN